MVRKRRQSNLVDALTHANTMVYYLQCIIFFYILFLGNFSFQFSDLIAPQGRRPTFAQVYTLTPDDAVQIRSENIADCLGRIAKHEILLTLEELMRENPYGMTFATAGEKLTAARAAAGDIPRFQVF